MALTLNCTLIAALAALGPFAAVGMQDPSMNTQIAFPKHVKESNTLGQLANSILAISEIATSSQAGVQAMTAPFVNTNCSGQEAAKSTLLSPPSVIKSLTPTTVKSSSMGFTYQIQLPAVKSGQTFTIQVPGYEVKSLNPLSSRSKSLGQVRSTSPSRRVSMVETLASNRLTGPVYDKKVSVRFNNATLQKVLEFLTAQGVSFALDNSGVASDRRVTLNAVNKRLGDIIAALGDALGGHWTEKNGFLIYKQHENLIEVNTLNFGLDELPAQIEKELRVSGLAVAPTRIKSLIDKEMKLQPLAKGGVSAREVRVPVLDSDKVINSLTQQQLEKHKAQGYLLFSDLNLEQIKLMGVDQVDQTITIVITKDGQTFTFKTK